ncbi:hypothetical protein Trydic_g359 [Trypoxylus dichotomus]
MPTQDPIYLYEAWMFENCSNNYTWQHSHRQTVKKLKTEERRYIVSHADNSDGFIKGASLIFSSKTRRHGYEGENKMVYYAAVTKYNT